MIIIHTSMFSLKNKLIFFLTGVSFYLDFFIHDLVLIYISTSKVCWNSFSNKSLKNHTEEVLIDQQK